MESIVRPLAAMLAPMGPRAQEVLISCLPDPMDRAVKARLRHAEDAEEDGTTPLEKDLRAQAEEAWGQGTGEWENGRAGEESGRVGEQESRRKGNSSTPPLPHSPIRGEGRGAEGGLALADALALILRRARPAVLTRALLQMPDHLPAEVLYRIAAVDLSRVSHRIEKDEAGTFFWRLREALGEVRLKPAPELAARALKPIAPNVVRRVLTALHRIDPGAMKTVQDLAYAFEDLVHLSDPELQIVLTGVDNRDVAMALQTAPVVVQHRMEQSLSSRRRQIVDEEAALAGEVSEVAAQRARSRIVDRARLLYEQGQLHTYFGSIEDAEAAEQGQKEARKAVYDKHATWVAQWIRRSGPGRRQSVGVAVAAAALVVGGWLFLRHLRTAGGPARPVPEVRAEGRRKPGEGLRVGGRGSGEESRGTGEIGNRGITPSPTPPLSHSQFQGAGVQGLRVSLSPGGEASGEGFQSGAAEGRKGVWLRMGTMRVTVLDPTATLETPLVWITGEGGAAYRVRVGLDTTTRLTALRGALSAVPADGRGGPTRVEAGQEAVFLPGGVVKIVAGEVDAEDRAWLAENR